jgi:DNA-directed RNA polymerase subunit RPC12/RpoP
MLVTTLLFGLVVLVAAGLFGWVRLRSAQAELFLLFRCANCGQKVRYLSSKAGREALCPRCRQRWTLPKAPPRLAASSRSGDGYPVKVGQRQVPPRSAA